MNLRLTTLLIAISYNTAAGATLDEIISRLGARDKALKTYVCDAQVQVQVESRLSGETMTYAVATKVQVDRPLHRFLIHNVGQTITPPTPFTNNKEALTDYEEIVGFEGEKTRVYRKLQGYDSRSGKTAAGRYIEDARILKGSRPRFVVNPEDAVGKYGKDSIGMILKEGPSEVKGGGKDVVTVECIYPRGPDSRVKADYRMVFDLDTNKDMAPLRIEASIKHEGDDRWSVYREVTLGGYAEVEGGLWLPGTYGERSQEVAPGGAKKLFDTRTATLRFSSVNESFPSKSFDVNIPKGVKIIDEILGSAYTSRSVDDEKIASDAQRAQEIRTEYQQARAVMPVGSRSWGRSAWVIAAAFGLIAITAAAITIRSARRSTSQPRHGEQAR